MSSLQESFNATGLSRFLNTVSGRIFRIVLGVAFISAGLFYRHTVLGIISILWGILPLTAGLFDICYVSMVLGGPLSGRKIRELQGKTQNP